ncbi:MAG: serine/threonine-protein kinase, partial [Myxococcota bacterium]
MTLEPGRQLDRYRVEDKIGEGGFSVVYKVHHLALERDFALKLLKVDRSDLHERLLQEGRVQAKLAHPNVVAVRDVIEVDGVPGLILDWVEDGSLSRLLDHHRLTHHEIDRLAQGILEGVVAAHELGLVHRDLKPQNVLLERTSAGYVPKVADFGLARVLMPDHDMGTTGTRSGVVMGTPAYMAPEQIENAALADARSDVFALGAVLYELACGQVAFDGDKLADVLYHVANVRYRPLDELVPDLPERMRLTIAAALQERPDRRTQSAAEMLAMWRGEIRPERLPSITLPAPRAHPVAGAPEMGRLVRRLALVAAGTAAGSAAFVLFLFGQRADRRSEVPSAELVAT